MPSVKNTETEAAEYRVVGPPGCGKTTWLGVQVQQAVESGMSVLISSLTKAAATEIGGRNLPISFDALGTLHSHCYHALGRPEIAEGLEHLQQWNEDEREYRLSLGSNDFGEKIDGDNLEPARETPGDELMEIYQICRARMIETGRMPARVQAFAQRWSDWKEANGLTDFTGLIETCLREVPTAPNSPDVMFVDEAQDLDLLEMSLIRKWGSRSASLYIVGDPDQAIFTWRGADPSAFTASQIPEENRWVLSQSYRVPIAVHAQAIRWISRMEGREPVDYLPRDHEGDVRSIKVNWKSPENAVSDAEQYLERGLSVMFLASCSYMLQPLIRILRETGTPFHNPYRRRNGAWNPLQRRWGQTTTGDRILAFLQMTQGGLWTAEDVNRWTEMVKVKGTLNEKGRKIVKQLVDGEEGMLEWDAIHTVFTEEAVEAGLMGNLDWFEQQLTSDKKTVAKFPLAIIKNRGPECLNETPRTFVGTVHCSPGDELIFTTNGWVRMEDLDPAWHRLPSHRRSTNEMTWGGTKTISSEGFDFKKSDRTHQGKLTVIKTEGSRTRVTPNHRLPVCLGEEFYEKWCCYLMRKGNWWRIGMCATAHKPYRSGGVSGRLGTEQADDGWILSIHETREAASMAEAVWQAGYGIPGITFRSAKNRKLSNQQLEEIHESTKDIVGRRVKKLFRETNLQENQPLYTRAALDGDEDKKKTAGHIFTTAAGNLTPLSGRIKALIPKTEFLERRERKKNGNPTLMTATVSLEDFNGTVYGLDVPPYHHYISGGAVVHNSVKGAEADVVYLFPDISRAGMGEWQGTVEQKASVYRLFYVAMTRAKDTLVLAEPSGKYSVNLGS